MNNKKALLKCSIEKLEEKPLDDSYLKSLIPNLKIIKYSDLVNYNDIRELLKNKIDYIIILYQIEAVNNGHWVALLRYDNIYEYFDSYGKPVDEPLEYNKIGLKTPYLSILFNKLLKDDKTVKVIYNPIKYQQLENDINTCGRHCAYRINKLIKNSFNLNQYYKFMNEKRKETGYNYDQLVSIITS